MLDYKKNYLIQCIERAQRPLIAYSGGVDSSYLLFMSQRLLGSKAQGIFISSPLISAEEIQSAQNTAKTHQFALEWMELDPLSQPAVAHNTKERCYHCKKLLFSAILAYAKAKGFSEVWDGSNWDDRNEYRPGRKAIQELGVSSPLEKAELTKTNVRELARLEGLAIYNKPSKPCLLTRFPYDLPSPITKEQLLRVAEGERILSQYLINNYRLRQDGQALDTARIEALEWDLNSILEKREAIVEDLKKLGYRHIALDLAPYSSGSFDR